MRCCVWLVLTLQVAQAALPSFLVFLVDDLGFADLGCFGSSNHSTPHIDAMRAGGLKLTQWISAAPICTPSRAALQTGRLPRRYGMTANQLPWRVMTAPSQATGLPSTELTVASLLKQRGYSTGMSGKWHLGMSNATTKWAHLPRAHGYDSWLGTPFSNMHHCTQGTNDTEGRYFCLLMGNETVVQQPFKPQDMTNMLTRHAIDFLEFNAHGGDYAGANLAAGAGAGAGAATRTPFFFLYSFLHVHTPLFSSPAFTNVSAGGQYGDNVEEMDHAVGQVLSALERLGMANDTLVLLTSDNGPFAEEGWDNAGRTGDLKGSKGQTWEGGIRMPALASWPGRISANTSSDALVGTVDLLPTLLSLAGADLPSDREYDGVDISSVLFAPEPAVVQSPHDWMFHWCGKNVTAVRHVSRVADAAGAPVQRTYKLHFTSQVWQTDNRPSPKCSQCCPYGAEAKFGHYDVMCECAGNALQQHDTPLVFSMDDDPQESTPLNHSTFPGGAVAFDLEVAAARAALRRHYDTIAPVPDQMHAQPNATLEPCCSGGPYVPNNDSFCRCDNYVPGKAYP